MKTTDLSVDEITLFDEVSEDSFENDRQVVVDHSLWLAEKEFRARLNDVWTLGFSFARDEERHDSSAAQNLATAIGDLQNALTNMTGTRIDIKTSS